MKLHDLPEAALVYEPGERRSHAEHAAEAYDLARRAQALRQMDGHSRQDAATNAMTCAQWHATMAVYELLALQGQVIA
jgi:hypothetical protein